MCPSQSGNSNVFISAAGVLKLQVEFGQIYLSKPVFIEADGETAVLFPKEARLRNITYAAPLYVDLERRDKVLLVTLMHSLTRQMQLGWFLCLC